MFQQPWERRLLARAAEVIFRLAEVIFPFCSTARGSRRASAQLLPCSLSSSVMFGALSFCQGCSTDKVDTLFVPKAGVLETLK